VSLFSAVADLLKPAPPPDPGLQAALDRVLSMVSPMLRFQPNLERQLAPAVEHALGYCAGLVAALPGPITINRRAFGGDPLVHALFATAGDIDEMLGRSQAIRDTVDHPESWQGEYFHAMLAARRQQKKQFGMAQHGNIIRNDVPQEILYFSDQTLVGPSCDLETTRRKLREKALESLLHSFNAHVEALRLERESLRADAAAEQSQRAMDSAAELPASKAHTRHLAELDSRLRGNVEALTPEHLTATLIDFLRAPEAALSLQPVTVNVDRMGIVHAGSEDDGQVDTLRFPELISRDRRQHIAMLVTIPCQDALAAVARARDQQHRYIII
jgi:hypothetical protein